MDVTRVTYTILGVDSKKPMSTVAYCSIELDKSLVINRTFILKTKDGALQVLYPFHRDNHGNNTKRHIYHPVNREFKAYMNSVVMDGYLYCRQNNCNIFYPDTKYEDSL